MHDDNFILFVKKVTKRRLGNITEKALMNVICDVVLDHPEEKSLLKEASSRLRIMRLSK